MADDLIAFSTLDAAQISALEALGARRRVELDDVLYREGDVAYDFYVVLSGEVEIVTGIGNDEQVIARHGPGRFLGELNLLTGLRVFVTARVTRPGEVLVVPAAQLRHVIATQPALSDVILAGFIARRTELLSGASTSIRVIGSRFSPETGRLREFLLRSRIPHAWLDPEQDVDVEALLREFAVEPSELPVVIATGSVLRRPTVGVLAEYLGITVTNLPDRCFDLVVVGGGPAGLAAAVYGASEGLTTLGLEALAVGGQAGSSSRIENYLGFPTGISGGDLTQRAVVQAEKFGAALTSPCAATGLREHGGHLIVRLADGTEVAGRAVIVASGAHYRRLDAAGLDEFECKGVYYAATEAEVRQCAPAPVVVVGGGNSAGQAALFLAESGSPVTVAIRRARSQREHVSLSRRSHRRTPAHRRETEHHRGRARRRRPTRARRARRPRRKDHRGLRRALLVHRRRTSIGLAVRLCRARRPRLRAHRSIADRRRSRRAVERPRPHTAPVRDEPPRLVRSRRHPIRIDEARRRGRRRRVRSRAIGPRLPRVLELRRSTQ